LLRIAARVKTAGPTRRHPAGVCIVLGVALMAMVAMAAGLGTGQGAASATDPDGVAARDSPVLGRLSAGGDGPAAAAGPPESPASGAQPAPTASAWAVDPGNPGPSLPPVGRSLFDQLIGESSPGSKCGRLAKTRRRSVKRPLPGAVPVRRAGAQARGAARAGPRPQPPRHCAARAGRQPFPTAGSDRPRDCRRAGEKLSPWHLPAGTEASRTGHALATARASRQPARWSEPAWLCMTYAYLTVASSFIVNLIFTKTETGEDRDRCWRWHPS
jgi:hypothetical protein